MIIMCCFEAGEDTIKQVLGETVTRPSVGTLATPAPAAGCSVTTRVTNGKPALRHGADPSSKQTGAFLSRDLEASIQK